MAGLDQVSLKEADRIVSFIRRLVKSGSAKGVVVGLSGGIDSAVVGALCVRALGKEKVVGVLMPSDHTPAEDMRDARLLAGGWVIRTEEVPISRIAEAVMSSSKIKGTKVARANIEARVRMVVLYYFANTRGHVVAGTGDRSEALLGYYTKFGDGGVDFLPIVHLYKTQVRQLGASLGLPSVIVQKPSSPQLWPGHKALDEIPADYDKLDIVLHHLFDLGSKPAVAASAARAPIKVVDEVLRMHMLTEHKRVLPPSLT